jgi:hypothetical protein
MFLKKLAFFIVCIGPFFFLECLASNPPYFQQDLSYAINVTLNDTLHELTGEETIVYKNNSNQPISYIYFHLWPNAFKNNQTLFAQQQVTNKNLAFYFSNDSDKGYIDQLSFTINSRPAIFQYNADTIDIGKLLLNEPLLPGQQITIHTPFQVKIPNSCSRLGHSQQQYQISQWYPKPAVFDNTGWHPLPYLDQGEFYAEFATYDVTITIPANYRVAATGDLQTASEQAWLQTLADSTQRIQNYSKDNSFPISSKSTKTISYHAEKVHDFAWFADKRYHVLKGKATLNDTTKTVDTYLFYTNKGAKYWKKGIPIINKTISTFSKWIGDYPYHQVAAVEGELKAGGGMEYPMVTVIGDVFSESTLETVIVHEVGHNWFQGILGSNERLYPWLDEGINSYYEKRLTDAPVKRTTKKKSSLGKFNKLITSGFAVNSFMEEGNSIEYLAYLLNARKMEDQATGSAAADFSSINYYADVYAKTPLLFNYLVAVMGQDSFDVYMQRYYKKWQFKHPAPSDIKAIFASSPFYLDWFFEEAIATNKKFDLQLKKIARATQKIGNSNYFKVTVVNKSNIRTPYTISAWTNDSIIATIPYGGFLGEMDVLFPKGKYTKLQIDSLYQIPEINRKNNSSKITGIFRKANPLKVIPFFDLEKPNKSELYYAPVAAWNAYDGLMLGLLLYNNTATIKRFSFEVMPFYSTASKQITGLANVSYDWYPKAIFQNIHLKLGVKSFTENKIKADYFAFMRFKPQLDFNFKKS